MRGTEVMSPEKQDNLDEVRFDSAFKARVVKIKPLRETNVDVAQA